MKYPDLPEKTLLRPDEVASFLSVDIKTVYRYFDDGVLRGTKPTNGFVRIFRASVVTFIEGGIVENTLTVTQKSTAQKRKVLSKGVR